nr:hypothetical protein [Tanacetum cinerariifolium]
MSSSTVTYMFISSDSDLPPSGFHLISDAEPQSPEGTDICLTHTPRSPYNKVLIVEYASAPTPPSPPPSSLSPLSSLLLKIPSPPLLLPPLHTSPTYTRAPLGYRATMVQLRAASPSTYHPLLSPSPSPSPLTSYSSLFPQIPSLSLHVPLPPLLLPSADCRSDILEADILSWKRLCLTVPASRFEVRESSTAAVARQVGHTLACKVDYVFINTLDESIRAFKGKVMTTVEDVIERVTNLANTQ